MGIAAAAAITGGFSIVSSIMNYMGAKAQVREGRRVQRLNLGMFREELGREYKEKRIGRAVRRKERKEEFAFKEKELGVREEQFGKEFALKEEKFEYDKEWALDKRNFTRMSDFVFNLTKGANEKPGLMDKLGKLRSMRGK